MNIVPTSQAGAVMEPLIRDPRAQLTFTGSTAVGRKLVEQSRATAARLDGALGGNAPFIVFEDADLDAAVEGAMAARCATSATCTAANRFFVHEDVAAEFSERLAARMSALNVGTVHLTAPMSAR